MTLQIEMVSCGDCRKCLADGKVHGPYWYSYRRQNGKVVSRYIGKMIDEAHADDHHPAGSIPEEIYPKLAAEMARRDEEDAEARDASLTAEQRQRREKIMEMAASLRRAQRGATGNEEARRDAEELRDQLAVEKAELRAAIER